MDNFILSGHPFKFRKLLQLTFRYRYILACSDKNRRKTANISSLLSEKLAHFVATKLDQISCSLLLSSVFLIAPHKRCRRTTRVAAEKSEGEETKFRKQSEKTPNLPKIFDSKFEGSAVQRHANLVDLDKAPKINPTRNKEQGTTNNTITGR